MSESAALIYEKPGVTQADHDRDKNACLRHVLEVTDRRGLLATFRIDREADFPLHGNAGLHGQTRMMRLPGAERRLALSTAAMLALLSLAAGPVSAVEYRLFVANIQDRALASYLTADELYDGGFGPGLNKMSRALDSGEMGRAAIVPQRALEAPPASVARAWGGVAVRSEARPRGSNVGAWDEIRWQGTPGERSIWIVRATGSQRPQQIIRTTLKGEGPMRLFQPSPSSKGPRVVLMQIPMGLIAIHESHGTVWDALVSKGLDLRHGIGGVVALSTTAVRADVVYIIVDQGPQPSTFKAVISWEGRNADREFVDDGVLQVQDK